MIFINFFDKVGLVGSLDEDTSDTDTEASDDEVGSNFNTEVGKPVLTFTLILIIHS